MTSTPAHHTPRAEPPARGNAPGYFILTFVISWIGALAVAAPHLLRGEPIPKFAGIVMFPVMLLGPAIAGMVFSVTKGAGIRALFRRMTAPFSLRWLGVLLVPPVLIAAVLGILTLAVSRAYAPNNFLIGLSFGLAAGFIEEIGWTGYAFPAMQQYQSAGRAALILGLLWSLWHLPVVDYLGTATPHGSSWGAYFIAFAAVMTAIRMLICWVYANTGSLLLAQLLHAVSTGSLVVLSPPRVTAAEEATWYFVYAAALWLVVATVFRIFGPNLTRRQGKGADLAPAPTLSRR